MMYVTKFDPAWYTILYSYIIDYLDLVVRHRYMLAFGRSYHSLGAVGVVVLGVKIRSVINE